MIYELEDNYINLYKLQYVSKIIRIMGSDKTEKLYYFRYTIGNFTWDSNGYKSEVIINNVRNELISNWIGGK